jgi:hypothetical protein
VNGGAPGAGGSDEVAVVSPLQENDQGGYERLRTREEKGRIKKRRLLLTGSMGNLQKWRRQCGTLAKNFGSLAALLWEKREGKR